MDDEQCSCGGTFHKVYTTRFEGNESVVYQCKCGKMALDPQKEDDYEDWPYLGIYMDPLKRGARWLHDLNDHSD